MSEPTVAVLGGNSPGQVARRLFLSTRPKFFTASVLPLILGSLWGALQASQFDAVAFSLALIATVCVHAAANVLNDVYDDATGNDGPNEQRIYPYTGGSRFIQNGVMDIGQMARWGWFLLVVGIAAGFALTLLKGWMIIAFGAVGVALAVLYSAPPVRLSGRGLSELSVGIAFGTLPIAGAAWLQADALDWPTALLSLPTALWVTGILIINEVPDISADEACNRRTLAVRLGRDGTRKLYFGIHAAALGAVGAIAWYGLLTPWCLAAPVLLFGLSIKAAGAIPTPASEPEPLRKAIEATLGIHAIGTIWLIGVAGATLWFGT